MQNPLRDLRAIISIPRAVEALTASELDNLYSQKKSLSADIVWTTSLPDGRHISVKDDTSPDGRSYVPKADWLTEANGAMAALDAHIAALEAFMS